MESFGILIGARKYIDYEIAGATSRALNLIDLPTFEGIGLRGKVLIDKLGREILLFMFKCHTSYKRHVLSHTL